MPLLFVVALVFFLGACASTAPPSARLEQQLTRSSTAVDEAEEAGAQEHAPLALRDAEKKLRLAQEALAEGKQDKALRLAEQAEVDAELAEVTALSSKAQQAAQELHKSIQTLREEISRKGNL
jgi:hypothetical protein